MTQSHPAGKPTFRFFVLKHFVILSLLFIVLNGVTLWRAGSAVQGIDVVRMVVASMVGGCLGAVVMWFLPGRKR
ncbi:MULTISPECIES: hypothetical protein [unclassified Paludibacterium]|uniref:hypothetical protein n=1 Tax=unclassified Paludibacterium TaxID=2618429 RepID=UPI001C0438E3|nr:hypothetical protein [Paludibacterium sp. B53371]BEV73724.1 hypothetical protein THUN1379_32060 [Paludibacterium sp. THUN1379]